MFSSPLSKRRGFVRAYRVVDEKIHSSLLTCIINDGLAHRLSQEGCYVHQRLFLRHRSTFFSQPHLKRRSFSRREDLDSRQAKERRRRLKDNPKFTSIEIFQCIDKILKLVYYRKGKDIRVSTCIVAMSKDPHNNTLTSAREQRIARSDSLGEKDF